VSEIVYIFDIDGTITPPRQPMNDEFVEVFLDWICEDNKVVYLATGSDITKVREQVPAEVIDACTGVFCCLGNQLWEKGLVSYERSFLPSKALIQDLKIYLTQGARYPIRTGNHIEVRTGMVNFSVIGRNATQDQREEYREWDLINQEREDIVDYIKSKYKFYEVSIGGSISVDIYLKGSDKSQVVSHLRLLHEDVSFVFAGDKTDPGGNDHAIVEMLEDDDSSQWFKVNNWQDTLELIYENEAFV